MIPAQIGENKTSHWQVKTSLLVVNREAAEVASLGMCIARPGCPALM